MNNHTHTHTHLYTHADTHVDEREKDYKIVRNFRLH